MEGTTLYSFYCEWDIGYQSCVFASEEVARKHVRKALKDCGIEESLEECEGDGLVGFEAVSVIDN